MRLSTCKSIATCAIAAIMALFPVPAWALTSPLGAASIDDGALTPQAQGQTIVREIEPNDTTASADALELGTTMLGTLRDDADLDWHKVELPYAGTLGISLETGAEGMTLSDWSVDLFNGENTWLAFNGYSIADGQKSMTRKDLAAGTYYIRVRVASNHYAAGSFYLVAAELSGVAFERASVTVAGTVFDGTPQEPAVTVSYEGDELEEGVDYDLEYLNNAAPGTGKVVVRGKGMFDGKVEAEFPIAEAPAGPGSQSDANGGSGSGANDPGSEGSNSTGNDGSAGNAGSGSSTSGSGSASSASSTAGISMYRLYNPNSGEHFYTADIREFSFLASIGWRGEGVGWVAPKTGDPVYRLYNPNSGDHHYTMSASEKSVLVRLGWVDEGIGWRSAPATGVKVYRQYNPNVQTGSHNYTTSRAENDYLVSIGWKGEGVGWYALR